MTAMNSQQRPALYRYVGEPETQAAYGGLGLGSVPTRAVDVLKWIDASLDDAEPDGSVIATYVVTIDGALVLANRRTEHVGCARGMPVRAAGELAVQLVRGSPEVVWVTNQSTGFCPEPSSWIQVRDALCRLGVECPDGFETAFEFRLCESCGQRNLIKESVFECAVCCTPLPADWNFGHAAEPT